MYCYHCGVLLSEHDFCTACGANVVLYKKIVATSNALYNEGLEKANVRDLSGAVECLRQSLEYNKNNIEARNLLGLVYFEMGEVVSALSEWILSKNLRPEKNIADDFMEKLQSNQARFEAINSTIKKYNIALNCCRQGNKDMAVLQLKKVLSVNPRFVRAHLLLALLYMDSEKWDRAQRELKKCIDIDRNNTQALRYLKEVEHMLEPEEDVKGVQKKKKEEAVRYVSDNELIIQPVSVGEQKSTGWSTLLNIAIGLLIGAGITYFLMFPAVKTNVNNDAQKTISEISNQLEEKTLAVKELENQNQVLSGRIADMEKELTGYVGVDGSMKSLDDLVTVAAAYLAQSDEHATSEELQRISSEVNLEEASEGFRSLFYTMQDAIAPGLFEEYNTQARSLYDEKKYEECIPVYQKAVAYASYSELGVDAYFFLARAYHRTGDNENAVLYYQKVLELYPDSDRVEKSREYLDALGAPAQ
ncbi:MAG: tetratricopeptide repeat protein [Acetatifactor sp.]